MANDAPDPRDLEQLRQRLERLELAFYHFASRIEALEKRLAPPGQPLSTTGPEQPLQPPPPAPQPPAAPVAAQPAPAEQRQPAQPHPAPPPRPAPAPQGPSRSSAELESRVLHTWASRLGAVALIIAAALFLQHAFRQGWISPSIQVALGLIVGVGLIAWGEQKRSSDWQIYGEALTGAGLAILYSSVYAAYAFYNPALINQELAFIFMAAVTAIGVLLAVRASAQSTAVIATLGGFLTPVVLQGGSGGGYPLAFLSYLALLDLGLLLTARFQKWRPVEYLALAGTWFVFWGWLGFNYSPSVAPLALLFSGIYFLLFLPVPLVSAWGRSGRTQRADIALLLLTPAAFFPTSMGLIADSAPHWLQYAAPLVALLYLLIGFWSLKARPDDKYLYQSWLGVGLALSFIAMPFAFEDYALGLVWAAECALLVALGHFWPSRACRWTGLAVFSIPLFWALGRSFYSFDWNAAPINAFLNQDFGFSAGVLGALLLMILVYAGERGRFPESEVVLETLSTVFAVGLVLVVNFELVRGHYSRFLLPPLWAFAALVMVLASGSLKLKGLRLAGYSLGGVVALWLLVLYQTLSGDELRLARPFVGPPGLAFGASLVLLATLRSTINYEELDPTTRAQARGWSQVLMAFLLLWGLTAETSRSLHYWEGAGAPHYARFVISALWSLFAAGCIGLGMATHSVAERLFGIGVLGLAVFKVFLYDVAMLESVWRILSFLCLGLILLAISYVYRLYGEKLKAFALGEGDQPPPA